MTLFELGLADLNDIKKQSDSGVEYDVLPTLSYNA